jgi:DNA-binding HxlR family transcriptional regulator
MAWLLLQMEPQAISAAGSSAQQESLDTGAPGDKVQKLDYLGGPRDAKVLVMKGYGSFCPVAKAAEILTERWTPLVLRELLLGSHHFNQLRRGIPQMSPTLLSKRLQTLEEAGLISRQSGDNGHWEYHPTQAAREARPIIDALGYWGHRWARSQLTPNELHAGRLMWNMRRSFGLKHIPCDFVLSIEIADARPKRWWFVVKKEDADLCWDDPGFEVDISLNTSMLTLVQIFIGELPLLRARELGKIEIDGPKHLVNSMRTWFPRSKYANEAPAAADLVSTS